MSTIIGLVSTFRLPLQKRGELDVRVTGRQEKVQKRSQRVPDWTLKWKNPQKSPKQASQSIIHILTIR